jgi:preprotein translocase subunit SecD
MPKKGIGSNLLIIFILAILSLNFVYPKYLNQGVDFFNGFEFSILNSEIRLSHFPDVDFKLGLDLQGGSHLVYEADLSKIEVDGKNSAMQGLRDVIERRVNRFGVGEPIVRIQEQGEHRRLIIELPGIKDVEEAIKAIGKTPYLEFKEQMTEEESLG